MATRRKVSNLLALAVLSYLTGGPQHPYELGRMLREHGDDRSIKFTHGSLYMVVRQLAEAGFVAEQETVREGQRPERTVYALTDAGRTELREWLGDLVARPRHEYPHFVAALAFVTALPPDEVRALLERRRQALVEQRTEVAQLVGAASAQGVPPVFLVEEEYRIALLDAEVSFVDRLVERINQPESDFTRPWREFHEERRP